MTRVAYNSAVLTGLQQRVLMKFTRGASFGLCVRILLKEDEKIKRISCGRCWWWCCFMSTETVDLLRTGAQEGHLDCELLWEMYLWWSLCLTRLLSSFFLTHKLGRRIYRPRRRLGYCLYIVKSAHSYFDFDTWRCRCRFFFPPPPQWVLNPNQTTFT